MKILLVIDQFDNDNNGTTMTARRLADTLTKHGHEVFVVSTGKPGKNKYVVKEIFMTPVVRHIVHSQGMVIARANKKVLREAMQEVDIVHFIMPFHLSSVGLRIARELSVPCTAAFHVQPENITYTLHMGRMKQVNRGLYYMFRENFFNKFSHIHCPSEFIAGQLRENGYTAKLHVISNGVDEDFVYRKKEKTPELLGKFVILMIGRLSNEKRQDVLIDAVKKSKYSDNIQLLLAGQGPKYRALRRRGRRLKNPPRIRFYTHNELLNVIAMSDLYVHAADAEIEAISCIEAFSSGLVPVIANSPKSATPQFALCEQSLFEAGNSDDLARRIDYWIENEQERRRMEFAYSEHGKKYSLDYCVRQMETMFEDAIIESRQEQEICPAKEC
ncbi:MAG: glycosyltransferase [Clostridiales bacterium]|nr:glycosyltransferase [Clostridiales bacterium]